MERLGGVFISGFVMILCCLIMVVIGISQIKSEDPVGFYTGGEPPKREDLVDVKGWNREHGIMWILFGICILLSWIVSLFLNDSLLLLVPYCLGIIVPLPIMMYRHKMLVFKYRIKKGER